MSENIDRLTPPSRARRKGQRMTTEQRKAAQDVFIKALENTANVRAACMQAGVSHTIIYQWQEHDTEFGIRFQEANKNANWLLFGEAWHRGMRGEERYVVSQGKQVFGQDGKPLTYREKSDRMLELLLKARMSEFREKQPDVNVNVNNTQAGTIPIDTKNLTNEELAMLKQIALNQKAREANR